MSNACGVVTSWIRCRPTNSCVCPFGSLRTVCASQTFCSRVPGMKSMVLRGDSGSGIGRSAARGSRDPIGSGDSRSRGTPGSGIRGIGSDVFLLTSWASTTVSTTCSDDRLAEYCTASRRLRVAETEYMRAMIRRSSVIATSTPGRPRWISSWPTYELARSLPRDRAIRTRRLKCGARRFQFLRTWPKVRRIGPGRRYRNHVRIALGSLGRTRQRSSSSLTA